MERFACFLALGVCFELNYSTRLSHNVLSSNVGPAVRRCTQEGPPTPTHGDRRSTTRPDGRLALRVDRKSQEVPPSARQHSAWGIHCCHPTSRTPAECCGRHAGWQQNRPPTQRRVLQPPTRRCAPIGGPTVPPPHAATLHDDDLMSVVMQAGSTLIAATPINPAAAHKSTTPAEPPPPPTSRHR